MYEYIYVNLDSDFGSKYIPFPTSCPFEVNK